MMEEQTLNRYRELAARSAQSGIYVYTDFHSPAGASLAYRITDERNVKMWGGAENCA